MRRQRTLRGFWVFGAIVFILILAFVGLTHISYFKIKKISIEGNITLSSEELASAALNLITGKYFFVFPKNNILLASGGEIKEKILSEFPRTRFISVSKNLPGSLSIKIEERRPTALLCRDTDCYFIDEAGYAFEKSPYFSGNIFIKFSDEREQLGSVASKWKLHFQVVSEVQFSGLMTFIDSAAREGVIVTDVILKKEGIYNLNTQAGLPGQASWQIILSERNDFKIAADNLKIVLENQVKDKRSELEYIDLRLANKVFYKFK